MTIPIFYIIMMILLNSMCVDKFVKTAKRNSGGITVLIRKEIEMYIEHVKCYGEGIIWFKLPKEILAHNMIFIYVVHISHQ